MARFEGKFEADGAEPLPLGEVLGHLGERGDSAGVAIDNARACYLSSSEGWREAVKLLGGTFADVGGADGTNKK